jgi:RNA polymerase sigma-70 factor (ECF subfamily)
MELELIISAQKGDKNAFKALVTSYKAAIYGLCYGFVREPEEAADLAQETFITAFNKLHKYRPFGSFKAWLSRIAYRRFLNLREKNKRRQEIQPFVEQEFEYIASLNKDGDEGHTDDSELIKKAFEKLPEDYKMCLELKYLQGFSVGEISNTLSIPQATVKTRLYRGKCLLARAIKFVEENKYEM